MAPNKFEKQLKETLESRTIAPSSNAWSQLTDKLDAEDKKRKFPMWWLGIAATLVGVLLAVTFFNNEKKPIDSIVNETKNEVIKVEDLNLKKEQTNVVEESTETQDTKNENTEVATVVKKTKKENQETLNKQYQNNISQQDLAVNTPIDNTNNQISTTMQLVVNKDEINIATIEEENQSSKEATDLLEAAYAEVSKIQNTYKTEKIDADSLLEEVEIESEVSLKNRLFHVVKSGYETVKTAVVERDQ